MSTRPHPGFQRHLTGAAIVVAAIAVRVLLGDTHAANASFAVFAVAIAAAAWLGGIGPGLIAAGLAALCCVRSSGTLLHPFDADDIAVAALLFACGAALAVIGSRVGLVSEASPGAPPIVPNIFDAVSDAIIVADADGRVMSMNAAAAALTGMDAAAALHLDALFGVVQAGATLASTGRSEQALMLERPDGTCRALSVVATRIEGQDPVDARLVLVLHDTSSRQEAGAAARHADAWRSPSERRLQSILDSSEARLFHLDRQFRLTWANRALRDRHGIEDGAGMDVAALFEPQKRVALMRPLQRAMDGHSETLEWRAFDAAGEPCWTFTMVTPDRDENGDVRGCVVLCLDATERHQGDAARQRSEDQRRGLLESLPDLVWMAAADGTCEWFNHRWAAYTGRSVADWRAPVHPDDRQRVNAAFKQAHAQGTPLTVEARLRRSDDIWRWHLVRMQPLRVSVTQDTIWGWCGSCTDIDDQKRAAATLRTTQQRISTFLGTLSHELRNPLAAVSAAVQVLRHPRVLPEMAARALETLDRQTALLARMVDELLDAARVMEGRIDLQRRRVALNELLREVCQDQSANAEARNVTLRWDLTDQEIVVDADLLRIRQALENIVINAINACAAGDGVTITARKESASEARVRIVDTGCGLSSENIASLFEPGATAGLEKIVGFGLGLKTVNRIVQLHGGRIVAASDGPGTGATFDLFFPLHEEPELDAAATQHSHAVLLPGQRILIISKDAIEIDGLFAPVEHGAQIRYAAHGFEGLRIAEGWPPTALVCDVDLPEPLSGYDVVRQMLAFSAERRPYLVAIGNNTAGMSEARAAGFDDYLTRPVSLPHLLDTLALTPARAVASVADH